VLQAAGLWDRLEPTPRPAGHAHRRCRRARARPVSSRTFDAADISDQPFGWNLPNWLLRREMVARLADLPNVSFRPGTALPAC
jgi:2-octaprenyl-6-methoxyphenol hydroxylase